jgi:predicted transposase YbfD/YdcC
MKEQLSVYFSGVEDPRSQGNQRHPFETLIGTSLLAALAGIDTFSGIQDFVEAHLEAFSIYFEFPDGVPSHDTYQRLWDNIAPEQFLKAFHEFTQTLIPIGEENIVSIDGKTIRNSGSLKPLHIVSAWCQDHQLVLAQERVDLKSNEITAIPKLLDLFDLVGKIITIDAIGAQRSICNKILEKGGDYVISLKGNQGSLLEDVELYLKDPHNHELINESNDKGHGRIENRLATVSHDISWLQERHDWPGLRSIGMITATVNRKGKETRECRHYISSLPLAADRLNVIARAHWGIENQLHWRLDVIFNEDKACIRNENAAENMAILRKWALNILPKAKSKPDQSLKSVMRKNAMSPKHLFASVNKLFHA